MQHDTVEGGALGCANGKNSQLCLDALINCKLHPILAKLAMSDGTSSRIVT